MKTFSLKFLSVLAALFAVALLPQRAAADDDDDPPSRVARLSQINGAVSFNPAGTDDWVDAVPNRPMTTGDKLWADSDSRAELHLGSASLRISSHTGFSFLNLSDNTMQIQITEGTVRIRVKRLGENEVFEVDTPNLAFSVLRPGVYEVRVNESGDTTVVQVRDGQGEVTGGGSAYNLRNGDVGTFSGTDDLNADIQSRDFRDDDFDRWCLDRDRREDRSVSSRYVSNDVVGYEDLDDYGGWRSTPDYGTVWFPHVTVAGWAPYRYGHWAWISPWGWTWVDDAPWGFAPFHYGRWVVVGGVWGWVPCPPRPVVVGVAYVRPVYAPALVAWVGGPHFGVGVGIGTGPVGWFPLGPREVYVPSYHVSRTYVNNVNISNTTVNTTVVNNYYTNVVVNKNVNVTNVTYVNRTAVTATSGTAFTSAQPVGRNLVKVDAREVQSASVVATTPAVVPQQRSVLGAGAEARVRPPAAVQQRTVVAKVAPPPAPASFAHQSEMIRANGGRPISVAETRQIAAQNPPAGRAAVRVAPPARPGTPQNTQANRPGNQPQGQPQGNPGRPANLNPNQTTQPGNPANTRNYGDRPPSSRPSNVPVQSQPDPKLDRKQDRQFEDLRAKQDQERQKLEQQQQQQQQKIQQDRQRVEQQQQELQKLEQQRATQQKQQEIQQKQQQMQQKQQQQLEELERKHDQEQQKLQQQQQAERAKQANKPPAKQEKPDKKDKPNDKPSR
jgi:hypothetical protein